MTPREEFDELTASYLDRPDVPAGRLMRSHGLKVGGKSFAMLVDDDLVVKLPRARAVELLADACAMPYEAAPDRVMKEWARIPPGDTIAWQRFVGESFAYVTELHG